MSSHASIAVIYLLRQGNDIGHFARFLASYRGNTDPLAHDLVILVKGFRAGDGEPPLALLADTPFERVDVPNQGFDIGSYLDAASRLDHEFLCFFNSFSVILGHGWLSKLHAALTAQDGAGVVGATGSWEAIEGGSSFPNYHLRTNAFLIRRRLFCGLETWPMRDKRDASLFEAGPRSMTRQIIGLGLEPYVVDRCGRVWAKEDWPRSNTFRSGDQEGLLVADNRTRAYGQADALARAHLRNLAWTGDPSLARPLKRRKWRSRLRRWFGLAKV